MPSQLRSEASRRTLVSAASKVISGQGLPALRIREIASHAGMSPAGVLYHYPQNVDLLLDVHKAAVDRYVEFRRRSQEGESDPRHRLVNVVRAGIPPFADEDVIRLLFEMGSLASRGEAHARLMTGLWEEELALYVEILEAGQRTGDFRIGRPVADSAAILLGLEDGLARHLAHYNAALNADRVLQLFLAAAATELGCPSLPGIAQPAA
jgi:AcrR family transcriptional regulator